MRNEPEETIIRLGSPFFRTSGNFLSNLMEANNKYL